MNQQRRVRPALGSRVAVAVVTIAVVVVGISGCSSNPPSAPTPVATKTTTTPSPAAEPDTPVVLHGVIGTGTFTSPDGSTTGTVSITAQSGQFYLTVTGFHSTQSGALQLSFSPWPASTECLADQNSFGFGNIDSLPNLTDLPLGPQEGDPTFYRTLVLDRGAITPDGTNTDPHGCVLTPLAFAPITWTAPNTRPYLHATDNGSTVGAEGTVTNAAGEPASYLVTADDNLDSIARRFGITVDDIRYLNPFDSTQLEPGQTLNLDNANRDTAGLTPPPHN